MENLDGSFAEGSYAGLCFKYIILNLLNYILFVLLFG